MSTTRSILLTAAIVPGLFVMWTLLSPETTTTTTPSSQQSINSPSIKALLKRIDSLENDLANEQSSRQQLELRLSALEQQSSPHLTNEEVDIRTEEKTEKPVRATIKPATLQDKLRSAMIPLDTIERIQQQVGENRLARLQLRNQAIREDWIDTPEYFEKQQQLPGPTSGLREQFGDQVYDNYLYASGRPNRVIVREVFSGSAASEAGIEPDDIILSYAFESIYTMNDLQQATTEGIAGEPVLIEIMRDELPFSTSAPRGPLGISMTMLRQQPE